jgi:hypothetical protein
LSDRVVAAERFEAAAPYYESMLEWVQSRLDQGDTDASYRKIFDPLTIFNRSPIAVEPFGRRPHSEAFWSIRKFEVPEAYVAVLPGGFACGDGWRSRSAIFTPDRECSCRQGSIPDVFERDRPDHDDESVYVEAVRTR